MLTQIRPLIATDHGGANDPGGAIDSSRAITMLSDFNDYAEWVAQQGRVRPRKVLHAKTFEPAATLEFSRAFPREG